MSRNVLRRVWDRVVTPSPRPPPELAIDAAMREIALRQAEVPVERELAAGQWTTSPPRPALHDELERELLEEVAKARGMTVEHLVEKQRRIKDKDDYVGQQQSRVLSAVAKHQAAQQRPIDSLGFSQTISHGLPCRLEVIP